MAHPCSYCSDVQKDYAKVCQRQNNFGLLVASLVGHYNCVKVFIEKGADVNCYDSSLRKAIGNYRVRTATGENPLAVLDDGTSLMHASACGNIESVKLLVNKGADVNMIKSQGTALGVAACQGHYKCVEFLIEAGASVNIADTTVTSPLISALAVPSLKSSHEKCIDLLIASGTDVNACCYNNSGLGCKDATPLVEGAKRGNGKIISLLLAAGAHVNLGIRGNFPLHKAVSCARPFPSMKLLLRAGVDVNQLDSDGLTPLHLAVCENVRFWEAIRQRVLKYHPPDRIHLETVSMLFRG